MSTGGIARGESSEGVGWAKDNMEVFFKTPFIVSHSHHPLLSDVTAGHVWLAERRVATLSCGGEKKEVEKKA